MERRRRREITSPHRRPLSDAAHPRIVRRRNMRLGVALAVLLASVTTGCRLPGDRHEGPIGMPVDPAATVTGYLDVYHVAAEPCSDSASC